MRWTIVVALLLAPLGAAAQQGLRETDERLGQAELGTLLSGHLVEFYDSSRAIYRADGSYEYRYTPEDGPFVGRYAVTDESSVCVTFDNGFGRCDTFVEAAGRLVLITEDGLRFPVRERRALD